MSVGSETGKTPVAAGLRCKLGLHDRMARTGYGAAPLQLLAGLLYSCGKVSRRSMRLTGSLRLSHGRPGGFPGRSRFSKAA